MNRSNIRPFSLSMVLLALALAGCSRTSHVAVQSAAPKGLDISLFKDGAFVQKPAIVDCETAAGTKTTCHLLKTSGGPAGRSPGPYCPRTISDGAKAGGGWFAKEGAGKLVDLTGVFIAGLAGYYNDANWKLHDPATGKVRYTATKEACLGAARPDVEEQYKQNCIECEMSYLENGFSRTYLIPTTPVPAKTRERIRTAGIALDGAELSGPAPVDAILGSYTIAAFDDCGGHTNQHQGYHYHAATGCSDRTVGNDGYAPLIGYAPDGYAIYAMKDAQDREAQSLDECRGTSDPVRGYHYRAASPSENKIIGCLRGESVRPADGGPADGAQPARPDGQRPAR